MNILYFAMAFLGGAVTPLQAGLNRRLGVGLGNPLHATIANFMVGSFAAAGIMFVLLLAGVVKMPSRLGEAPWWSWLGGLCGVALVFSATVAVDKLGYAGMTVALVAGQMVVSIIMDHFGILAAVREVSLLRIAGVALLVAGVILIQRG